MNQKQIKNQKQPMPCPGKTFTSWAIFNWGISHDRTFRTRKEAQEYYWRQCGGVWKNGKRQDATCWNDVKDHMAVVKVKCTVL